MGIPIVTLNFVSGSVLAYMIANSGHLALKYIIMVLSFICGLLSIYQTFFGFQKQVDGHRNIGNRYLEIMKEVELIIAIYQDKVITNECFIDKVSKLTKTIGTVNSDASIFSANNRDYKKAKSIITNGEETYEACELEIP